MNEPRLVQTVERAYHWTLRGVLHASRRILLGAAAFCGAVTVAAIFLAVEFLPERDEGAIRLRVALPGGTGIHESAHIADGVPNTLARFSEARTVLSTAGRNDDGTDAYGANRIEFTVPLRHYSEWNSTIRPSKS